MRAASIYSDILAETRSFQNCADEIELARGTGDSIVALLKARCGQNGELNVLAVLCSPVGIAPCASCTSIR